MPELPEVETVRRSLGARLVGRRIQGVEVGRDRVVRRTSVAALVTGLRGATVTDAQRRGKYLLVSLDNGRCLMVHLRMSGQLRMVPGGEQRQPHTHVVLHLDNGDECHFIDPRTFGEMVVFDPATQAAIVPELDRLGIDPIRDEFAPGVLDDLLGQRRRNIKAFLLDQRNISGIGNIYADEILHRARINPRRPSNTLTARARRRLHDAIVSVLAEAITSGGSTIGDGQYVDLDGAAGSYQNQHRVYGRAGHRCRTCGVGWIRTATLAQRSTYWCPYCQRSPRGAG